MSSRRPSLSVYGYTDHKLYLNDYYEHKKSLPGGYSYRTFSRDAGFSSPNILKMVIEGKRNIGEKSLDNFAKALRLEGKMKEYFINMVRMNQATTDPQRERFYKNLRKLIPHSRKRMLNGETFDYLSHWINPVIREMVELKEFSPDPYWISNLLHMAPSFKEISKSMQFLKKENFIKQDNKGRFHATENMVVTSEDIKNLSIRNYHRAILDLAKEMITILPVEDREFGALTIKIKEQDLKELKQKIKAIRQDLHMWSLEHEVSSDSPKKGKEVIVQINLQMFPHTKI